MSPRRYRAPRRAEAAADTRRRIVEATFALHEEQGIAATSMKQIAERAGVSVGTVYHHFPTYEDAVNACGEHSAATVPPPGPAVLEGAEGTAARLARLAAALFDYYARLPVLERARCDQHLVPSVRRFIAAEERNRQALARAALGPDAGPRRVALAAALTDPAVHGALTRGGWTTEEAAREVGRVLAAGLGGGAG